MGLFDYFYTGIRWTVYLFLTAAAGILGTLYFQQTKLIYPSAFPEGSRQQVPKPSEFGMNDYQDVVLKASDGVTLKAYFIRNAGSKTTLIYYHANAGNMGHRLPIAKQLMDRLGCNVFMLSYRGYGLSEGEANEEGMKLDAQAALDYVVNHDRLKGGKVLVYGQSIGGAVAIAVCAKNQGKIDAMIIENTFLSMKKVIMAVFGPYLGYVSLFCHQKWNSEQTIASITDVPVLFLSGLRDELVPSFHMKELHGVLSKYSKQILHFVELKHGTHNDTCIQPDYFESIQVFWKKASMGKGNVLGS